MEQGEWCAVARVSETPKEFSYGSVEVNIPARAIRKSDLERLVGLGQGLGRSAEFEISEHADGLTISLSENAETEERYRRSWSV